MFENPEIDDDEEELEPEPEIDSNGFFCRFTPWQIDKMASHLLGEKPLCEKWISRDGKEAILYPLRLSWTKKTELAERPKNTAKDVVDLWKTKFGKKPPKTSI